MEGMVRTLIIAIVLVSACERNTTQTGVPAVPPRKDIAVPPPAQDNQAQPAPSVRSAPTGEIPEDPRLAAGHKVYRTACMVCHDRGVANAPALSNLPEWRARIAQGKEILYLHAINGYTGKRGYMPPKGGSPGSWSDDQVKAAVDYMVYVVERQM